MNGIETQGLTKRFSGFKLENIDLALPQGCIMGLIGENGAGKSTLIRLLLDMYSVDEGTITLLGQPLKGNAHRLKQDIGVVLDEVGMPSQMNLIKIGKLMRRAYRNWDSALYAQYLQQFQLDPQKRFRELSKGMKMKLGLAVALSHHPKLLILDEATAGLDPLIRDEVLDVLMDFTRDPDHSVLISSHIISDLEKVCDYIAFLHRGKLVFVEEKDALRDQYGVLLCSREELAQLPQEAIYSTTIRPYGVEVIVRREKVPEQYRIYPVDIEQLFITMTKEMTKV